MRQAGRYLSEYLEVRATTKNFLEFCYNPKLATEVTLQPIKRFNMDAAIIFSDILVVPDALGVHVEFIKNEGPKLLMKKLPELDEKLFSQKLSPVYSAIKNTRQKLDNNKALIGFVGAPFTLCCYMIDGSSENDFAKTVSILKTDKLYLSELINISTNAVICHARNQIDAGAQVIQIFDSWAGLLSNDDFYEFSILPTKKICDALNSTHPNIKIIGFPRNSGDNYIPYAKYSGVNAVSFDQHVKPEWICNNIPENIVTQGNLDPEFLCNNIALAKEKTLELLKIFSGRPHVFNLGHGVMQTTPVENVRLISDIILNYQNISNI